jgi:hypothetical protein
MARNRVSTEVLATRGAFEKDPARARARAGEPKPVGVLGPVPKHLNARQKKVWRELERIATPGVAALSDRWAFELLACLMTKFRDGQATAGEAKQIESLLSKMGMTASDRSRVSVQKPKESDEDDPLAEFIQ